MPCMYAGPSAPRSVAVRVGYNSEVCATWAPPALPVGTVILYKLYAEAVENSVEAVDVVDLPSNTAVKVRYWTHTQSQRECQLV